MRDDLDTAWREARPDNLESLRRWEAALARGGVRWEGRTAREWVTALGTDEGEAWRQSIAAGLAAVPALLDALRSQPMVHRGAAERDVHLRYLEVLEKVDPAPTCAIPVLLATLQTRSALIRRMTLALLARLRPRPTPRVLRVLLECLEDRDADVRARAAQALSRLEGGVPASARAPVVARLADSHPWVRRFALAALGSMPPDAGLAQVLEEQALLDDDNRTEALAALLAHGPERALSLLLEEAGHAHQRTREHAARFASGVRAIALLGARGARARSVMPALRRLKPGSAAEVFIAAALRDIQRDVLRQRASGTSPPAASADEKGPSPPPPSEVRTPLTAARPSEGAAVEGASSPRAAWVPVSPTRPPPPEAPITSSLSPPRESLVEALLSELPPPESPDERAASTLVRWARAGAPRRSEARVRMVLAVARRVAGLWDDEYPDDDLPRRAVLALEDWLREPTEERVQRARHAGALVPSQLSAPAAFAASWAITHATQCLPTLPGQDETRDGDADDGALTACLRSASGALSAHLGTLGALGTSLRAPESRTPSEAVRVLRQAIVDEVLPWARGEWDPVKDIVTD